LKGSTEDFERIAAVESNFEGIITNETDERGAAKRQINRLPHDCSFGQEGFEGGGQSVQPRGGMMPIVLAVWRIVPEGFGFKAKLRDVLGNALILH